MFSAGWMRGRWNWSRRSGCSKLNKKFDFEMKLFFLFVLIALYFVIFYLIQVYEGAVYMRQGKTYLVKKLDLSSKTALCEEADLKYYTRTRDYTDVHVNGGTIVCQAQLFDLMFYIWLLIT